MSEQSVFFVISALVYLSKGHLFSKSRFCKKQVALTLYYSNSIAKFRRPLNLLINLTVKSRAEKVWLLYKFPFSLNPSDILNDAQTRKSDSSLNLVITEDQF